MRKSYLSLALLFSAMMILSSCATYRNDRCYMAEVQYIAMRELFEETGSYQRVGQAMKDAAWAHCEINQFRYRLRKELGLDDSQYDVLFVMEEPNRNQLDFNPGRVENAVQ